MKATVVLLFVFPFITLVYAVTVKQKTDKENPLTWYILQQLNLFSKKFEKLSVEDDKRQKSINQLKSRLSTLKKAIGERKSAVDTMLNRLKNEVAAAMRKATKAREGCQSGNFGDKSDQTGIFPKSGYIAFNPPFSSIPAVTFGYYVLDVGSSHNLRVITDATSVSRHGFQLKINTWADTRLYGAKIRWMACPKSLKNK